MIDPNLKIAIYMEGSVLGPASKMGLGVLRYSQNPICCVLDSKTSGSSLKHLVGIASDVPIVRTLDDAIALGAKVPAKLRPRQDAEVVAVARE